MATSRELITRYTMADVREGIPASFRLALMDMVVVAMELADKDERMTMLAYTLRTHYQKTDAPIPDAVTHPATPSILSSAPRV